MSVSTRIIGLIILLLIHLILSEIYLKRRLNIKAVSKSLLSKWRKKVFVYIEILLLILLVVCSFYVVESNLVIFPLFLFFTLLYFFRGIEEWREDKREKGYYHEWLSSLIFFVMFLFMLIGEYLLKRTNASNQLIRCICSIIYSMFYQRFQTLWGT